MAHCTAVARHVMAANIRPYKQQTKPLRKRGAVFVFYLWLDLVAAWQ